MKTQNLNTEKVWALSNITAETKIVELHENLIKLIIDLGLRNQNFVSPISSLSKEYPEKFQMLYKNLIDFIKQDPYNERIILYLPTEWIPDNYTNQEFRSLYKKSWFNLLEQKEYRANFFNGDIPEIEFQNEALPLVVKAAHLLPFLLEKALVNFSEVLNFVEKNNDSTLLNSIIDTIPYLVHLGLITKDEISSSKIITVKNCAYLFNKNLVKSSAEKTDSNVDLVLDILKQKYDTLVKETFEDYPLGITQKRLDWLNQNKLDELIESSTVNILNYLKVYSVNELTLEKLMAVNDSFLFNSVLNALVYYIEHLLVSGKPEMVSSIKKAIIVLLEKNSSGFIELTSSVVSRLYNLGVLNKEEAMGFSSTVKNLFETSIDEDSIRNRTLVVKSFLESNKLAKDTLYSCFVVYGSMAKGHEKPNADTDIALFCKPGISKSLAIEIENEISKSLPHIDYLVFVLDEEVFVKQETLFTKQGNSTMSHVFFNGIWIGKEKDSSFVKKFFLDFYTKYQNSNIYGNKYSPRFVWLNEIERDLLQCRLLHKGYKFYHNALTRLPTKTCKDMDPSSTFWNYGYRVLATLLFIKKVKL